LTLRQGPGAKVEVIWSQVYTIHVWAVTPILVSKYHPGFNVLCLVILAVKSLFKA